METPKVFISYSHDSPDHRRAVLRLANRLREDGVDAHLDWYEDSPPQGWPAWMREQIRGSDYVIVICTDRYHRRAMGEEVSGRGLGVRWESGLITQTIYDSDNRNYKFVPIVFKQGDQANIPDYLRSATFYDVSDSSGYEALLRHLTRQPAAPKPPLGPKKVLPPVELRTHSPDFYEGLPQLRERSGERHAQLDTPLRQFTSAKRLKSLSEREARTLRVCDPHVAALNTFVGQIRKHLGLVREIPYFDPDDGGVRARVLFLFESPGPGAVESGFISRDNPDETARTFLEVNEEVGIDRSLTVTWNLIPWFIGTGGEKDRAFREDLERAMPYLRELVLLLPAIEAIVLVGSNTWKQEGLVRSLAPAKKIFTCPTPSPLWVNRNVEENRGRILRVLGSVRDFLGLASEP